MVEWAQRQLQQAAVDAWPCAEQLMESMGKQPTHNTAARQAALIINDKCPGHGIGRPSRFIPYRHKRWVANGDILDAPGRGRQSMLTPGAADRAIEILLAGYLDESGQQHEFPGIRDAY